MLMMMIMTPGSSSVSVFVQNIINKKDKGVKTDRRHKNVSNKNAKEQWSKVRNREKVQNLCKRLNRRNTMKSKRKFL
jgi:hypothetical protein